MKNTHMYIIGLLALGMHCVHADTSHDPKALIVTPNWFPPDPQEATTDNTVEFLESTQIDEETVSSPESKTQPPLIPQEQKKDETQIPSKKEPSASSNTKNPNRQ